MSRSSERMAGLGGGLSALAAGSAEARGGAAARAWVGAGLAVWAKATTLAVHSRALARALLKFRGGVLSRPGLPVQSWVTKAFFVPYRGYYVQP